MITIYYNATNGKADEWQTRLDKTMLKSQLILQPEITEPRLTDGDKQVAGITAIDNYINDLEKLVQGWYEDRCDRYDFEGNL